jgi:hypothetical protein
MCSGGQQHYHHLGEARHASMEWAPVVGCRPSSLHRGPRGCGGDVSRDNGGAHLGGSVRRARRDPQRWCTALGFAGSPFAEVWLQLEVWWVMDGYGSGVWVVLQGKVRSWGCWCRLCELLVADGRSGWSWHRSQAVGNGDRIVHQ